MQKLIIAFALSILLVYQLTLSNYKGDDDDIPPGVYDSFTHYEVEFNKVYQTPQERSYRLHVFYANFQRIMEFMEDEEVTFSWAYTIFSDRTAEEYLEQLIRIPPIEYLDLETIEFDVTDVPATVDWRKKGIVSSVKNQGECGLSWAFSATGALESYFKQQTSSPINLSEQQLLDCSYDGTSTQGCKGGWPKLAFQWIQKNGLVIETDYPYVGERQVKCKIAKGTYKPAGFKLVTSDTLQLKAAVAQRPVSVCFDASQMDLYDSEIINGYCDGEPTLCGLLVGYDEEAWIVQSVFGELWGEQGYVRILLGNTCGIQDYAMFPI